MNKKTKQVIVIRKDLGMRQGKAVSQGAHASLGVILNMMKTEFNYSVSDKKLEVVPGSALQDWLDNSFTKITLYVNSENELLEILENAGGLPKILITDNGTTEFNGVPTKTCIAIGPAWSEDIDKITGHLKLL